MTVRPDLGTIKQDLDNINNNIVDINYMLTGELATSTYSYNMEINTQNN